MHSQLVVWEANFHCQHTKLIIYRHAALGMVAETISLGILGLPQALGVLGLIPGTICFLLIGAMASYAGFVIGQFKLAHPHVHSMGDAGEVLFGWVGRELFGSGAVLFIIFIMGSHLVAGGHTLNVLTDHKACTIWFVVVILVVSFVGTIPRTLKNTTSLSMVSCVSVLAAALIVMVNLVQLRPGFQVDENGMMPNRFNYWPKPSTTFAEMIEAVTTIMFAYAGHVAFLPFASELKNPKDFNKSLALLQTCDVTLYTVSAVVIYIFAGETVRSPALDSASPLMRKVAWGVALPTIVIAGVINGHVAVKYVYVRSLRNNVNDIMHQNTIKAVGIWCGIGASFWVIAWVLAESIPQFKDIVGLTGALFASWFTFGLPGMFWLNMSFRCRRGGRLGLKVVCLKEWTWKKTLLLCVNVLFIVVACFTVCAFEFEHAIDQDADLFQMTAGLYASITSMRKSAASGLGRPFSCDVSPSFT